MINVLNTYKHINSLSTQNIMQTFSVTYPSTVRKEGKIKGKWETIRRGKKFVTVITSFKKVKKSVSFEHDSDNLQKPQAATVAVYKKKAPPIHLLVKTFQEIEQEDLKAAMAFLSKKRKRVAWKPSYLRNQKKRGKDGEVRSGTFVEADEFADILDNSGKAYNPRT